MQVNQNDMLNLTNYYDHNLKAVAPVNKEYSAQANIACSNLHDHNNGNRNIKIAIEVLTDFGGGRFQCFTHFYSRTRPTK